MAKSEWMIDITNLHKSFGKKEILKGIDLKIAEGEFYGVFGKNGAGKSTLFKNILGLVTPTEGKILIAGNRITEAKKKPIGYLPENVTIYSHMSVKDNLQVAALSAGAELGKSQVDNILEKVNLQGSGSKLGRDLSLGMKRRLQFAMAAMTKPIEILILDEPTNGMDVNGVLWLREYLMALKKKNVTILACSHSLNVMESLIDKYCIIKSGKIVKESVWENKKETRYIIYTKESWTEQEFEKIKEIAEVVGAYEDRVIIECSKPLLSIAQFLTKNNLKAADIEKKQKGLEEIFVESVQRDE